MLYNIGEVMMMKRNRKKVTMSITLDEEVKEKIDKLSKRLGINRSALLTLAFDYYLEHRKIIDTELFDEKLGIVRMMIKKELEDMVKKRNENIDDVINEVVRVERKLYRQIQEMEDGV